jgi:deoxyadenosine/deoxycytidine kinase
VGKTTLLRALCARAKFNTALEQHTERPFQTLFKTDKKYALANQLDYMLFRAEQEKTFRATDGITLMDGGLDQDFHGFTKLFHQRGLLNDDEFNLCQRFYEFTRATLPAPDLFIYLYADSATIRRRLDKRNRINIATPDDLSSLASLLTGWLVSIPPNQLLRVDVSEEDEDYEKTVGVILKKISLLSS